jgi:hypothetical protein
MDAQAEVGPHLAAAVSPGDSALQIPRPDDHFPAVAPLERLRLMADLKTAGIEFERAEDGVYIEREQRLA